MTGRGLFVSVDGPGGVGKTTAIRLVAEQLESAGVAVHVTTEPTRTPLGELLRAGTGTYSGMALACLVAGDRHHHLAAEVRPHRDAGRVVISDRYLPSSYVLQRLDGLTVEAIAQVNAGMDVPDLAIVLNGDPDVIAERLHGRGTHSRFEQMPDSSAREAGLYRDTAARLTAAGWPVEVIDCTTRQPGEVAAIMAARITATTPRSPDAVSADPERGQPVR